MGPTSNPVLLHHVPVGGSSILPIPDPHPLRPPSSATLPESLKATHGIPQSQPPHPLPRHVPWLRPHHTLPHPSPQLGHLLPSKHQAQWASLLLGLRLLPLQDPRVPGHALHRSLPLLRAPHVPPRVPPRHRARHVLPLAPNFAVSVPGGARDQRLRACAHVRLLLPQRARDPTAVEARRDGLPDRAVRVQLRRLRFDAVPALLRVRLLRDLGLVLQCGFQCFSFSPVR
ncbi:uncharacterized protein DS421_10g293370 [Arachis hypogaea]|nr:uncharacterized protein DS421_10g293370 [Arachis hypogaea]